MSVELKVYDILGNEISTLVNEELTSGEYEVEFSVIGGFLPAGRQGLTSGVYFYQLKVYPTKDVSVGFIQTKKMLLLR